MNPPVVVGVDGSRCSHDALAAGVEEARLRETVVRAVHVWDVPAGLYADGYAPTLDELQNHEYAARMVLDEALAATPDDPDVEVEPVLIRAGSASQVLVEESSTAALLVVGSRGLHGWRGLVHGSVSHACSLHAHCPVLVIPAGTHGSSPGPAAEAAASY